MRASSTSHRPSTISSRRRFYPADLLPDLQSTLGALADIDVRYAIERDRLDREEGSRAAKQRLLDELENRCAADREPYVRRLRDLQRRMGMLLQRH